MTQRVIIDTDPGIDDVLALLLAFRAPELDVVGLTIVPGNIDTDLAARNAHKVLALAQTSVPVAVGPDEPLRRPLKTAPFIHGSDGLGDMLPAPAEMPFDDRTAAQFLVEEIMAGRADTLIALGPLTNVAIALKYQPRLQDTLDEILVMGGAVRHEGNTTPAAEFNIYTDPEAADIVFASGIPIRMVGLNVTMQAVFPHVLTQEILSLGDDIDPVTRFIGEITDFYSNHYRDVYGIDGCCMHDPLTIAGAIDPDVITTQFVNVRIETQGDHTVGATIADFWQMPHSWGEPNTHVALEVDADRFLRLFVERVTPEIVDTLVATRDVPTR